MSDHPPAVPGAPVPAASGQGVAPRPRQLPGAAVPVAAPPPPLRFTCPACFRMLEIALGSGYRGEPAPCPECGVLILPPQVFGGAAGPLPPKKAAIERPARDLMPLRFIRRRKRDS
jgi:hypothetical protein